MKKGTQITARHVRVPWRVKRSIRARIANLGNFYPDLIGCSVVIEGPGRHHRTGGPYTIRIDIRVPGGEPIIVNRQHDESIDLAIGEAFDVAVRQLEDFARVQRGQVKVHEEA